MIRLFSALGAGFSFAGILILGLATKTTGGDPGDAGLFAMLALSLMIHGLAFGRAPPIDG